MQREQLRVFRAAHGNHISLFYVSRYDVLLQSLYVKVRQSGVKALQQKLGAQTYATV